MLFTFSFLIAVTGVLCLLWIFAILAGSVFSPFLFALAVCFGGVFVAATVHFHACRGLCKKKILEQVNDTAKLKLLLKFIEYDANKVSMLIRV